MFRTASFVVKQLAFNQLSTGQNRGGSPNFSQGSEARGYFIITETNHPEPLFSLGKFNL